MYIPDQFLATDRTAIVAFMQRYSFATIVTARGPVPVATHLPFLVTTQGADIQLHSHFAKANPQWHELADHPALVIFSEPHAYISPTHYEQERNVPTWNYLAVHAYGHAQVITDPARTFEILEALIATYEAGYRAQWDRLPASYKTSMAKGIVAFSLTVTDLQAKQKLSQNKTTAEQERIQEALASSDQQTARDLAAYMGSGPALL